MAVFFLLFRAGRGLFERSNKPYRPEALVKKTAAKTVPKKTASKVAPAQEMWLRSASQGNFPAMGKKTPLELKVKALDNVWLRITADGKILFQSILKRGESQAWAAKESIEIWTGNSSNMVLSLNGYNLGSPGKGVVKKLTINHSGVKIPS